MAGLGFAMSENVLYYGRAALAGGLPQAFDIFLLRGVASPFLHPLSSRRRRGSWWRSRPRGAGTFAGRL
jgi:hypothetical protein